MKMAAIKELNGITENDSRVNYFVLDWWSVSTSVISLISVNFNPHLFIRRTPEIAVTRLTRNWIRSGFGMARRGVETFVALQRLRCS
jgi:hypothetical protein